MPRSSKGIHPSHSPIKQRNIFNPPQRTTINKIDYYNKKSRKTTFNKNVTSMRRANQSFTGSFNTPLQFGRKFTKQSFVNLGSNRIIDGKLIRLSEVCTQLQ